MLGWSIIIVAQTPLERAQNDSDDSVILARWVAAVGGLDWLTPLLTNKTAIQLFANGYPNRYFTLARDVLPLIAKGPPPCSGPTIIGDDYVLPGNWTGKASIHADRIAACAPDRMITIDAWDLS